MGARVLSDPPSSLVHMSSTISPGMHPVLGALQVIETGLDDLGEANLWSLLDGESLEVRERLERLSARLYAAKLASTRDVDSRGAAVKAGASSLRAWLINRVRIHPGEATREVLLAAQLDADLPATSNALAAGVITPAAASVIADADAALRKTATAAERAEAEALLVEFAETIPVRGLQNAAIHLRNRLDPDQGDKLEQDEEAQVAKREFRLTPNPDGSSRPGGYLDKEATALLRTALDPLAKPRPGTEGVPDPRSPAQRSGDALVELVELALRSGDLPSQAGQPVQVVVTIGLGDLQSRFARALTSDGPGAGTFHHTKSRPGTGDCGDSDHGYSDQFSDLPAGTPASLRDVFARLGAHPDSADADDGALFPTGPFARPGAGVGVLDDGTPVSAAMVRRWACDCQLIPIVLGAHGEPLDAGRASQGPHPGDPARPEHPGQGLRVPRLRPSAEVVHQPPHPALGERRAHELREPGAALRAPSPGGPPSRLGRPDRTRRAALLLPTHLDRPRPSTPTPRPIPTPPTACTTTRRTRKRTRDPVPVHQARLSTRG